MNERGTHYSMIVATALAVLVCGPLAALEEVEELAAPIAPEGLQTGSPEWLLKADFNGNGFGDVAVGTPQEDGDTTDMSGAVSVRYSSGSGFLSTGEYWEQVDLGGSAVEDGDQFGSVLAVGDFDGDGVYDLAIGVPKEDWFASDLDVGVVHVVYGVSGSGLSTVGTQFWHQDVGNIDGAMEADDKFGSSLAVGDFNNDGYDDLAIGVPEEDVGSTLDVGAVQVIYGSAGGLVDVGDELWVPSDLSGDEEASDMFGTSLAAGDFDGDGYDDLAIGSPNEDLVDITNAGAVDILFGASTGLTTRVSNDFWHQDRSGIADTAEASDGFGRSLAAGDFNDDGYCDLAIAAPGEDWTSPAATNAGAVHVLYGSSTGPTATGSDFFYQGDGHFSASLREDGDQFGFTLTTGDFNGDGYADLAVGSRWEDWNVFSDAGVVEVTYGGSGGLGSSYQAIPQDYLDINGNIEELDNFGATLAATDFNGDGYHDLVIGSPFEDIDTTVDAGWINILPGGPAGLGSDNILLFQSGGDLGTYEEYDRYGLAVAAIPPQTAPEDLIFADGFESSGTGAWTDVVP